MPFLTVFPVNRVLYNVDSLGGGEERGLSLGLDLFHNNFGKRVSPSCDCEQHMKNKSLFFHYAGAGALLLRGSCC